MNDQERRDFDLRFWALLIAFGFVAVTTVVRLNRLDDRVRKLEALWTVPCAMHPVGDDITLGVR